MLDGPKVLEVWELSEMRISNMYRVVVCMECYVYGY